MLLLPWGVKEFSKYKILKVQSVEKKTDKSEQMNMKDFDKALHRQS